MVKLFAGLFLCISLLSGCGDPPPVFTGGTAGSGPSTGGTGGTAGTGGHGGSAGTGGAAGGPVTCSDGTCADVLAGQCFAAFECSKDDTCKGIPSVPGENDNDACTKDACTGTVWVHVPYTAAEIDDGDPCTTDTCSAVNGITHEAIAGCIPPLSCSDYCKAVEANCGMYPQFASNKSCEGICAVMPPGMPGSTSDCSVQWCAKSAMNAAAQPQTYCPFAGPHDCGTDACANFCFLVTKICGGLAVPPYKDIAECLDACPMFPDDVEYSATVISGNSLACRLHYVTIAAQDAAALVTHCPNVAVDSAPCQ